MAVVDIDIPDTWPSDITRRIEEWCALYGGSSEYSSDLPVPLESEDSFRRLFSGHSLRAYHATRLLPHERGMVEEHGLRPLTLDLVCERIDHAEAVGAISADIAAVLREENVFRKDSAGNRENQVCLILSDDALRHDVEAVETLLTVWGGEAMFKAAGQHVRSLITGLGTPTIVTALLDVSDTFHDHSFFPALHLAFVDAALGLEGKSGDVLYRNRVPAHSIERISQPPDPWYDRYPNLSR